MSTNNRKSINASSKPIAEHEAQVAAVLNQLDQDARAALHAAYPPALYPTLRYQDEQWDRTKTGSQRAKRLLFTEAGYRASHGGPLPQELVRALKACIALRSLSTQVALTLIDGARHLWRYLQEVHGWESFYWHRLRPPLLEGFATFMESAVGPSGRKLAINTRAIRETELNTFLAWLAELGLVPEATQVTRSARQQPADQRRRQPDVAARRTKLPDRRALEYLARLYVTEADPWNRLMLALCGILMITGLRESEVRDLPLDCLEAESATLGERVRFRYWNRKPSGSTYFYAHRWLSPAAAGLAKELVQEVRTLTAPARETARQLELGAPHPALAPYADRLMLTRDEAAEVLGYASAQTLRATIDDCRGSKNPLGLMTTMPWVGPSPSVPQPDQGAARRKRVGYPISQVHTALEHRQAAFPLIAYEPPDGNRQMLSETLFCIADDPRRFGRPTVVRKLDRGHIADFLAGKRSIFARRGASPDERALGMRTHGFRHWLNTLANKAGLSVFLITVWMQRRRELHTYDYLWDAPEIADLVHHDVAAGRLVGPVADAASTLPDGARQEFLQDKVSVAHVGPGGLVCTKDMAIDECSLQQACPSCSHVLAELGNDKQIEWLKGQAQTAEDVLREYKLFEEGGGHIVPRLVQIAVEGSQAARALARKIGGPDAA